MKLTFPFWVLLMCLFTSRSLFGGDEARAQAVTKSIAELREKNEDLRLRAKLRLLRPEVRHSLSGHTAELIELLKDYETSPESAFLLGQIKIPKEMAAALVRSESVPDPVKARLGDKPSEERVSARFKAAQNRYELAKACQQLLYVGSPLAMRVFVEALGTTNIFQDVHGNRISQTFLLLQAYGQAHPAEPLLAQAELSMHSNLSEVEFQQELHQTFLRKVGAHFERVVGVPVQVRAPFFTQRVNVGERLQPIKR